MPRAASVVGIALVTLLVATAGHTQTPAPAGGAPPLSITSLVDQALALFPQLDGEVVEAQGQTLTISIGRKAGAQPGTVLDAVRQGREIRHPKTGVALGRTEEALGRVVINQVFDGLDRKRTRLNSSLV